MNDRAPGGAESEIMTNVYLYSVGVILALTGAAKLISSLGSALILRMTDPILAISVRNIFWISGLLELIVATYCVFGRSVSARAIMVAWLATTFGLYRISLLWVDYRRPCICLGEITDELHIPQGVADMIMKVILVYLLLGSYGILARLIFKKRSLCA
jgi:hypothetical protein